MGSTNTKKTTTNSTLVADQDWTSIESIMTIDLFSHFPKSVLIQLSENCKIIHLKDQEILCEEGSKEKKMWGLLSGRLLVFKLKKTIDILKAGSVLGEMSLIDQEPRSASIRSIGKSTLIEINEEFFQDKILTHPEASLSLLQTLSQRTRHNIEIIATECRHLHCLVHDLRNYLAPLSITEIKMEKIIQCLLGTKKGHRKREGAEDLDIGLRKMLSTKTNVLMLIDQTLSVTVRKKAGYLLRTADLAYLIQETVEDLRYHRSVKENKLVWDTTLIEDKKLELNYLDIKRVVQNLIINAGYASRSGSTITVRGERLDEGFRVSVADKGSGIPDDIKPLLLKEKFSSKPEGNGFGLLACREIIEDYHKGRIWFETEWGKGTTFFFTIPAKIQ